MPTYHIGWIRHGTTLIVETRDTLDALSPDLWRYLGQCRVSKRALRRHRAELLTFARILGFPECVRVQID